MNSSVNQANKRLIWEFWQSLEKRGAAKITDLVDSVMSPDINWYGPDPINDLQGTEAIVSGFWQPLLQSFPDLKRQTHIFFGGSSNGRKDGDASKDGRMWVTGTGYFNGTFANDYLGIPATGSKVSIRWGEFYRIEEQKVVEIYCLLDIVDLIQQAGFNVLPASLGEDHVYPTPKAADGILLDAQNVQQSSYTLDHIWQFIYESLNQYDESNLESMGVSDFFPPEIQWYGPGGIGACYSLAEFENYHQKHWLHAFPDREVQDLTALFGEGNYSGGPGWAGVKATHKGEYKGVPATGNAVEVNGLDWWKRDNDQFIENWVFVDMVHLFRQFGVDLFERLAQQVAEKSHREAAGN